MRAGRRRETPVAGPAPARAEPWMAAEELGLLAAHARPDGRVLEWGCGGSTAFLAGRFREVVSVEHDGAWVRGIGPHLPANATVHHVPPDWPYRGGFAPAEPGQFQTYVEFPSTLGLRFDAVLVDGRARVACALAAHELLVDRGILFFHDFIRRARYHHPELAARYRLIDAVWHTPQTLAVFGKR